MFDNALANTREKQVGSNSARKDAHSPTRGELRDTLLFISSNNDKFSKTSLGQLEHVCLADAIGASTDQ
ncbi:hypothetical protein L596_030871 [Steinernema carpocapsae]|uniref:Uncharacterized protein n=1 Tax=Steinernema carpocapsae TaxID=34508 RepID=A0A4U5LND8_STECR|nr:hypothetical protein L596_030871 [Steinernema carpocapsae]